MFDTKIFLYLDGSSLNWETKITIITVLILLTMAFMIVTYICVFKKDKFTMKMQRKCDESQNIIELQLRRNSNSYAQQFEGKMEDFDSNQDLKNQVHKLPYNKNREIKRSRFKIEVEIGAGNFGRVFKGTVFGLLDSTSTTPVAIKSIKETGNSSDIIDLLAEIKLMSQISPHPNLVSMIGSCSSDLQEIGDLWLLIEYCELGDFKKFLQENKTDILTNNMNKTLNSRCLINWLHDIAKGMQYLSESKIMHGDLSARNVLLANNPLKNGPPLAKIADFGLAKHFYDYVKYQKNTRILVPWKWMALEFLKFNYFTLTSDVWSFAVLVWEIFSFGGVPYGQQQYEEILERLETGYRLSCPNDVKEISSWNPEILYNTISKHCFVAEPESRASFIDVVQIIEKHLTSKELSNYQKMKNIYQNSLAEKYLTFARS